MLGWPSKETRFVLRRCCVKMQVPGAGCRVPRWVPGSHWVRVPVPRWFQFQRTGNQPWNPEPNPEPGTQTWNPGTLEPGTGEDKHVPQLTVEGYGSVEVPHGKRLVLAIEQDANVDVLHACGGNARCTTCRVEFLEGEPSQMTEAEVTKLQERGLTGVRLSCQILCDHDMTVRAISRLEGSGRPDPGPTPQPTVQPPPEIIDK